MQGEVNSIRICGVCFPRTGMLIRRPRFGCTIVYIQILKSGVFFCFSSLPFFSLALRFARGLSGFSIGLSVGFGILGGTYIWGPALRSLDQDRKRRLELEQEQEEKTER